MKFMFMINIIYLKSVGPNHSIAKYRISNHLSSSMSIAFDIGPEGWTSFGLIIQQVFNVRQHLFVK
jgi:hypothetical protein